MDLKYCDCVVFVCMVLGYFKCGMKFIYVCMKKFMVVFNFVFFFVFDCELVEEVWVGDIIGILNYG